MTFKEYEIYCKYLLNTYEIKDITFDTSSLTFIKVTLKFIDKTEFEYNIKSFGSVEEMLGVYIDEVTKVKRRAEKINKIKEKIWTMKNF